MTTADGAPGSAKPLDSPPPAERPAKGGRASRRSVMKRVAAAAAAAPLAALTAEQIGVSMALAQGTAQAGGGASGQRSFELAGRLDQEGAALRGYGYLIAINGMQSADLFTDPADRSDATARFTFVASTTVTARSVVENLFMLTSTGTLRIYFNPTAGAAFASPESFGRGQEVASFDILLQTIVNVLEPNRGLASADCEATQLTAEPFDLQGRALTFGRTGLRQRLSITGQGTRSDPDLPRATFAFAGGASVIG